MLGLLALMASVAGAGDATRPVADARAVETAARAAMAQTGARGLAIAVIDQGEIASVQAFGERDAKGRALTTDTVMYGASLTKTVFAHYVLMLADEGRVALDAPIASVLPRPLPAYGNLDAYGNWGDLEGDDRWRRVTPRHVLTHSAGFANFAFLEQDGKLRFHFEPGRRYAYSGEGIMLLQFMLDEGLRAPTGEGMDERIFKPLGMASTSLRWRAEFAANLADGWRADGSVEPHDERSKARAAGSMDTTISDMARYAAALVSGFGLKPETSRAMAAPQLAITSAQQFPTLIPEAPPAKRHAGLAAGLGVIGFVGPQGPGFFKGGHNDSTGNTMVCVERNRRCVVILANDVRAEAAFPQLVRSILGETGVPYRWEYPGLKSW
ncbi:MAG: beta-lactamase family protein [Pseudomonadota bacterium]|jgi:CubicO group peptidase (beta-lactamase class C family)|nr:beta-lactamase family protein [Pseudomonadota bacterium]